MPPRLSLLGMLYFLRSISHHFCLLKTQSKQLQLCWRLLAAFSLWINFLTFFSCVVPLECGCPRGLPGQVPPPPPQWGPWWHLCAPSLKDFRTTLCYQTPGKCCPAISTFRPCTFQICAYDDTLLKKKSVFTQLQKVPSIKSIWFVGFVHSLKGKKKWEVCFSFWITFKETEHLEWKKNRFMMDSTFCKKKAENHH